jgi:phospholipid/cholesterol/gamma-HCH transport system substrate-binding protein
LFLCLLNYFPYCVKISKEFKVGLLGILALVILYFGYGFLKGSDLFVTTKRYFVKFDDIEGLTVSNPVMLNGYSVGLVKKITLIQGKQNQLLLNIDIDEDILIGDSARLILSSSDLLGGKMLVLDVGKRGTSTKTDTLMPGKEEGLTQLIQKSALPMIENINKLFDHIDGLVLSFSNTAEKLNSSLDNMARTSGTVDKMITTNEKDFEIITDNLRILSGTLINTEKSLSLMMGKYTQFGDSLNKIKLAHSIENLNKSVKEVQASLASLNAGKGTMGKMLKDDSLYYNLSHSAASLDLLLKDLKARPKRYVQFSVFGKKERKEKVQ